VGDFQAHWRSNKTVISSDLIAEAVVATDEAGKEFVQAGVEDLLDRADLQLVEVAIERRVAVVPFAIVARQEAEMFLTIMR
jgi:hypothetical protein